MVKLPKKNKNTRNPVTYSPGIIFTKSCFLFNQFFFLVSTVVTCWVSHRSSRINTFNLLGLVLMVVLFGADGIQTAILMNFIFLNVYRGGFQNVEPFIPLESCGWVALLRKSCNYAFHYQAFCLNLLTYIHFLIFHTPWLWLVIKNTKKKKKIIMNLK